MPIPNTSTLYQRIKKGSEGGQEFARIMNLILIAESKDNNQLYDSSDDAAGDFKGVDAIQHGKDNFFDHQKGYQFKFYPSRLTPNHRHEIKSSLKNAIKNFEFMEEWILVTPEDWIKYDMEWFDKLKKEYENDSILNAGGRIRPFRFRLRHWGHTEIIELALKHPHIGRHYFPELYKDANGLLSLANFMIDEINTNWNKSKNKPFQYYQSTNNNQLEFSSDPVFDVQILNNTKDVILFQSIEFIVEKVENFVKGIPEEYCLKSIGTIMLDIDFNKEINTKIFDNPIIINPKMPLRCTLQLRNFVNKAHGNWVKFHFKLNFNNEKKLKSKSFTLSF